METTTVAISLRFFFNISYISDLFILATLHNLVEKILFYFLIEGGSVLLIICLLQTPGLDHPLPTSSSSDRKVEDEPESVLAYFVPSPFDNSKIVKLKTTKDLQNIHRC